MIVVWFSNVTFRFYERPIYFNISTYLKQASRKTGQWVNPHATSMVIGSISKTRHKTTPTFLLQFISTAATEMSLPFKTLFMISIYIFLNRKNALVSMFPCVWWKKQIHHTSSESSWNSILPLGVWLVSNASSIPSPAALSSTCCCSTEYLCTKNLHAHSEHRQIIGATAWKQKKRLPVDAWAHRRSGELTCHHRHISWQTSLLQRCSAASQWWLLSQWKPF